MSLIGGEVELESAASGLTAYHGGCKVADSVGLSLDQIARLADVTEQALSATPDLPAIHAVLRPIAQLDTLRARALPGAPTQAWLHSPNLGFGNRAPSELLAAGEAEVVLLKVANAFAGHPG